MNLSLCDELDCVFRVQRINEKLTRAKLPTFESCKIKSCVKYLKMAKSVKSINPIKCTAINLEDDNVKPIYICKEVRQGSAVNIVVDKNKQRC